MEIKTASGHVILADDDDADFFFLRFFSWFAVKTTDGHRFYAHARMPGTGKRVLMHRLIMEPPPGTVVHHRNNNGLDNRQANLEITTQRRNILYAHEHRNGGVHLDKKSGRWRAQLRDPNGKFVSLGMYATRETAMEVAFKFKLETRGLQP